MLCDEAYCNLCKENILLLNNEAGLPTTNIIVYENTDVYITPDISPLCEGHFLIISNNHIPCFGNADNNVFSSLISAKDHMKRSIYKTDKIIVFEHGAVIEHAAGSCIDHAHMHTLPADRIPIQIEDIDTYIEKSGFVHSKKILGNTETLQKLANSRQPYLFYEINGQAWVYPVKRLPSQFFRSLFAYYLKKEYNWKETFKKDSSKELYKKTLALSFAK